jgi:muramoyltetrapeptide carboxypeptidase
MVAGNMRLGADGYDATSLCAALFGDMAYTISPAAARTLRPGEAAGELWGGCLTLLAALAGTRWLQPPARGLLVLEDVGVKPYQVHRMLVQLRDSGALAGTAGVVLGDFSACIQHEDQGYDVADVMAELIDDALGAVPISIGWPIGHASAPHVTLPMGLAATLAAPVAGASQLTWQRPPRS